MRKVLACILLALQLAFVGGMAVKANADRRAEKQRLARLLSEGETLTVRPESLYLDRSPEEETVRCRFDLEMPPTDTLYTRCPYMLADRDGDGVYVRFRTVREKTGAGLYLDSEAVYGTVCRDYALTPENAAPLVEWMSPGLFWEWFELKDGVYTHGGKKHAVSLRAKALDGEIAFTGLTVDGVYLPFEPD